MRGMLGHRGSILLLVAVRALRAARGLLAYLQVGQRPRYGAIVDGWILDGHLLGRHHCSGKGKVLLAEHAEPDMNSRRQLLGPAVQELLPVVV